MKPKTQVHADPGKQDLIITRKFDLPVELLFQAYAEPELVAQWMGTKVLKLESQTHGSYRFETCDPQGNVAFRAHGVIHEYSPNRRIIRTFEMEDAPFGVQLEVMEFEALTSDSSKLRIHAIYQSPGQRDQLMSLPFAHGLSMAHDRLQTIMHNLK